MGRGDVVMEVMRVVMGGGEGCDGWRWGLSAALDSPIPSHTLPSPPGLLRDQEVGYPPPLRVSLKTIIFLL